MPRTLDHIETRNAYSPQVDRSYSSFAGFSLADNSKDRHLRSARGACVATGNLPRRILREIEMVLDSVFPQSRVYNPSSARRETFVQRAQRLDAKGRTDAALDLIYDSTDQMLRDGQFDGIDLLLLQLCVKDLSTDMLLGLLTATLPARSRLQRRGDFFLDVKNSLRDRQELDDGLLTGLE